MDLLPRIEIDGASKTIGNSVVLDQIQLTVKPGEMIGLQGVNGSGKTMLLRQFPVSYILQRAMS